MIEFPLHFTWALQVSFTGCLVLGEEPVEGVVEHLLELCHVVDGVDGEAVLAEEVEMLTTLLVEV
jgi:hypothetical protein